MQDDHEFTLLEDIQYEKGREYKFQQRILCNKTKSYF